MRCDEGKHVAIQRHVDEEVFYMCAAVLEEFGVQLPLNAFEADVLKFMNMVPSQIRPNNWAFIRGFEILCRALGLEPFLGPFFYFYRTWIAISAHPGKKLFPPYASNFKKDWKNMFVKIKGA